MNSTVLPCCPPAGIASSAKGDSPANRQVIGASDADGMYVKDQPVEVPDPMATIFKKLGVDYSKEYVSNIAANEDQRREAAVVLGLKISAGRR